MKRNGMLCSFALWLVLLIPGAFAQVGGTSEVVSTSTKPPLIASEGDIRFAWDDIAENTATAKTALAYFAQDAESADNKYIVYMEKIGGNSWATTVLKTFPNTGSSTNGTAYLPGGLHLALAPDGTAYVGYSYGEATLVDGSMTSFIARFQVAGQNGSSWHDNTIASFQYVTQTRSLPSNDALMGNFGLAYDPSRDGIDVLFYSMYVENNTTDVQTIYFFEGGNAVDNTIDQGEQKVLCSFQRPKDDPYYPIIDALSLAMTTNDGPRVFLFKNLDDIEDVLYYGMVARTVGPTMPSELSLLDQLIPGISSSSPDPAIADLIPGFCTVSELGLIGAIGQTTNGFAAVSIADGLYPSLSFAELTTDNNRLFMELESNSLAWANVPIVAADSSNIKFLDFSDDTLNAVCSLANTPTLRALLWSADLGESSLTDASVKIGTRGTENTWSWIQGPEVGNTRAPKMTDNARATLYEARTTGELTIWYPLY